jgi:very-short-patch-repair endonuclease
MRRNANDAEQALWLQLRGRRLGGYKFRRQWTIWPYVVDFYCLEAKLIVEVGILGGERKEDPHPNLLPQAGEGE